MSEDGLYATGAFPELITTLADLLGSVTLVAPTSHLLNTKATAFPRTKNLVLQGTKSPKEDVQRLLQSYTWSFTNILKFRELQRDTDAVLFALPNSLTYLAYLIPVNRPVITLVAGDEIGMALASRSSVAIVERMLGLVRIRASLCKKFFTKSKLIICMDSHFKSVLAEEYGVRSDIVRVIPIGVSTDEFRPYERSQRTGIRESLGLANDDFVIGFVAETISRTKGSDILTEVYDRLRARHQNVRLLLIGDLGPGIADLSSDPSVVVCGYVSRGEMPRYYNSMNVLLFPSKSEGAPKVVMEALSCGVPVISTKIGGVPDMIANGANGFLAEPDDSDSVFRYCELLISNPSLEESMGLSARTFAVLNFSFADLVQRMATAILESIQRDD